MKYSGKPLTTSGDTKGRNVDARRLLERQNVAAAGDVEADEDARRAPADWVLVRRAPGADEEVVARSVVAYDLAPDRTILVTDGIAVHRLPPDGGSGRKLAAAKFVTSLVAL